MTPSVGDMMAVAMAAAGMNICDFAQRAYASELAIERKERRAAK